MFPIRDTYNLQKFPLINLCLIATNLYVFAKEIFSPDIEVFVLQYALIPTNVDLLNYYTLAPFLTSIFLHGGFLHILSNMWFLWIFGDNVEAAMGHIKYLIFYLFCGIAASFAQFLFISDSTLPMIGASGAIAGVLGAYYKYFHNNKIDTLILFFGLPLIIGIPASFMLLYWFITQAFNGVAQVVIATASIGGVAYLAHAGGFLTGLIFARLFVWQKQLR